MVKLLRSKNVSISFLQIEEKLFHYLGLELPLATQKTDTGLTMGILKILHKQVNFDLVVSTNNSQWEF